ncbi:NO-inducible flavohemoprotein [Acetobacter peroxydans]|uniref:nitric oxide dioxygenase n=1 Tax=Acetobacter peroxydans TaxID=104098 RepID=A0A4Y3TYK1_9PROT|nr:NO-inducible flavohemoprotein [Acetobacter peroxydans]NHO16172.1 NO-inducible flavohemoprotein [Acetobacter peroxydans]GBR36246.1 flavohemoprotein [Acetobacter peroxydans NBRC 13755]GBR40591.1 flavohemoprotein [Acetobacter peroxydans]GEB86090.1 flavohemoprotein [Acetobacter peroxydans]
MPTPLDEKTRSIILATVPALKAHGLAITEEMYKRLLVRPEIRDLFNESHQRDLEQPRALALAVLAYAQNINDLGRLGGMVERIAEKHVGLNILPEHYPFVADALLGAIAHVLGDAATPEIMDAWGKAYWFLADVLIGREKQIYDEHEQAPGGWKGWRAFKVRARRQETPEIASFDLVPADGGALFRHKAGQYLSFRLDIPGHGSQRRNYSISSAPGADHYRITVRHHELGLVSSWLHENVHEGDTLLAANPAGDFFLEETASSPVVFLTAGVGLTPIVSMLEDLCGTKAARAIRYVHGADTRELAAFVPEITALAADNVLSADFFYARDSVQDEASQKGVTRHAGRISTEWLRGAVDPTATYYICGPEGFMQDMIGTLRDAGLPAAQIRYEIFGSATNPELVL